MQIVVAQPDKVEDTVGQESAHCEQSVDEKDKKRKRPSRGPTYMPSVIKRKQRCTKLPVAVNRRGQFVGLIILHEMVDAVNL